MTQIYMYDSNGLIKVGYKGFCWTAFLCGMFLPGSFILPMSRGHKTAGYLLALWSIAALFLALWSFGLTLMVGLSFGLLVAYLILISPTIFASIYYNRWHRNWLAKQGYNPRN